MSEHISNDTLRMTMVRHKLDQDVMKPEYVPPEGAPGQGGPDAYTELLGFHRDYDRQIERILTQFPQGGSPKAIGDFLTAEAERQGPSSAGPYMRATMLELRDIVAPDYLRGAAAARITPLSAAEALAHLEERNTDSAGQEVLGDLKAKLAPGATARDVMEQLSILGDWHQQYGDDYLAETADAMKSQVRDFSAKHDETQLSQGRQQLAQAEIRPAPRPAAASAAPSSFLPAPAKPGR